MSGTKKVLTLTYCLRVSGNWACLAGICLEGELQLLRIPKSSMSVPPTRACIPNTGGQAILTSYWLSKSLPWLSWLRPCVCCTVCSSSDTYMTAQRLLWAYAQLDFHSNALDGPHCPALSKSLLNRCQLRGEVYSQDKRQDNTGALAARVGLWQTSHPIKKLLRGCLPATLCHTSRGTAADFAATNTWQQVSLC